MTLNGLEQLESKRKIASDAGRKANGARAAGRTPASTKSGSRAIPKPDFAPKSVESSTPEQQRSTAAAEAPAKTRSKTTKARGELRPVTVYLDETTREQLSEVAAVAMRTTLRGNSNSAVVRMALDQLLSDMSPEQIVDAMTAKRDAELAERARLRQTHQTAGNSGGRPRF